MTVPLLLSLDPVGLGSGVGSGVAEKNAEGSWCRGRSDLTREMSFHCNHAPAVNNLHLIYVAVEEKTSERLLSQKLGQK